MRTYRDKGDLKNEIRQSFKKYNSEFDTIPEALKDKRVPGVDNFFLFAVIRTSLRFHS